MPELNELGSGEGRVNNVISGNGHGNGYFSFITLYSYSYGCNYGNGDGGVPGNGNGSDHGIFEKIEWGGILCV